MKTMHLVGLVIAALSGTASAGPRYQLTELPPAGGYTASCPQGINDDGWVVGYSYFEKVSPSPVMATLWRDGVVIALGTLGGESSDAAAINRRGQIVGGANKASGKWRSFSWRPGADQLHELVRHQQTVATGLNNHGVVVGKLVGPRPEACKIDQGVLTLLGTLGGNISWATGINNNGAIVGTSQQTDGRLRPFLYDNGVMKNLGTLGRGGRAGATAINTAGNVTGWSELDDSSEPAEAAFLYSAGTMRSLEMPEGMTVCFGSALNDRDDVVGHCQNHNGPFIAYLWRGGKTHDLLQRVEGDAGDAWTSSFAKGINRSGQIAGCGWRGDLPRGYLLTPLDH